MTKYALFDFDKTLCRGDSILPFLLYCIRKGMAPKKQLFEAGAAYIHQLIHPDQIAYAKSRTLSFIQGKSRKDMDEFCRGFTRDILMPRMFRDGVNELSRLKEEGYTILITSASADVYMRLLPEFLPVDGVIATRCGLDEHDVYTGLVDENCKGLQKPLRIAEYLAATHQVLDYEASCAYGDSASDIPMLELTNSKTLVNARKKILARVPGAKAVTWR